MHEQPAEILILGIGGQACAVASIIRATGDTVGGFLDALDESAAPGPAIHEAPMLGGMARLADVPAPRLAVAIGDNCRRRDVVRRVMQINPEAEIVSTIHPSSMREAGVSLGRHVTLCLGSVLSVGVSVGDGVIVNTGAIVDHECVLDEYCHVSPGVRLAGRVRVGPFAHVGIGATVIDKVEIGAHATIGAGAVVLHDVPDRATAVGVPANVIKRSPRRS